MAALRAVDTRSFGDRFSGKARSGFDGQTIDDLVRYVILKTFETIEEDFHKKSPKEQEHLAGAIAAALRDLPSDEQDRIRRSANLPDLTAATLRQTGMIAGVGVGLSTAVGMAGFAAYTTLTSTIAAVTGVLGLHLSFGFYATITSSLFVLSNPFFLAAALGGGAKILNDRANRKIRELLFPTFVATSVMARGTPGTVDLPMSAFAARIGRIVTEIQTAHGAHLRDMTSRFPALGSASFVAKWGMNARR